MYACAFFHFSSVTLSSNSFNKVYIHLVGTWVGFDETKVLNNDVGIVRSIEKSGKQMNVSTTIPKSSLLSCNQMKRKLRSTGLVSSTSKRQTQKLKQMNSSKRPSPITPPPPPSFARNQKESEWKTDDCDFWAGEVSKFPTLSQQTPIGQHFGSISQQKDEEIPVSFSATMEITPNPTMRLHGAGLGLNVRRSQNMTISDAYSHNEKPCRENFYSAGAITSHENSERSSNFERSVSDHPPPHGVFINERKNESPIAMLPTIAPPEKETNVANQKDTYKDEMLSWNADDCSIHTEARSRPNRNSWKQSRRKQQREQKRAFTERKKNPFESFTHDPNDSEKHLEQLNLIPSHLLAKMKQKSTNSRSSACAFSRRRMRPRNDRQSYQEILKQKAAEQQFCQNQMPTQHRNEANKISHQYSPPPPPPMNGGWHYPIQNPIQYSPDDQSYFSGYQQHGILPHAPSELGMNEPGRYASGTQPALASRFRLQVNDILVTSIISLCNHGSSLLDYSSEILYHKLNHGGTEVSY